MFLVLKDLVKAFAGRGGSGEVRAVDGVSLDIKQGDLVTLLGPSGCGKTTTLRLIAGFEFPTSGEIRLDGRAINDLPPHKRDMSMVFQSYAIFPHLSVYENIAYGLNVQHKSQDEIRRRVGKVMELVELTGLENRQPNQLSGGQQQRVALARALVMEPKVLLMDEPLSNLDAKLREQMRTEIRQIQQRLGITSVYVTHDQVEAMTLSDQVVVMNRGKIEQVGPPAEVYRRPRTRFVADFIGRANFVPASVRDRCNGSLVVDALGAVLTVPAPDAAIGRAPGRYPRGPAGDGHRRRRRAARAGPSAPVRVPRKRGGVRPGDRGGVPDCGGTRPPTRAGVSGRRGRSGAPAGRRPVRAARMSESAFDLLMIGHFAVDRIIVDGAEETVSGGGVYYGSIAARRLGAKVGVVTRLREADFPRLEELRAEGIPVWAAPADETSGIANYYTSHDMERRICVPIGFAGPIQAADVPIDWAHIPGSAGDAGVSARIYAVTPIIAGEVELPLLARLAQRGPVAMDVQGFVRVRVGKELIFRVLPQLDEALAHVTYLKVDRAEAEALTGERDLSRAARALAGRGPAEIVLTESAGVTVYAEGRIHHAPFRPRSLAGRTGRGDTCFATYLTMRLGHSAAEACAWAGAVTTVKQETPGPWRGSPSDIVLPPRAPTRQ